MVIDLILLPGIVMPAAIRYRDLLQHLDDVNAVVKDLEVYREPQPPRNFSIADEVEGLARAADEAGLDRFHVYGHSGGGAVALAFAPTHPERLCSLAVDEPASDFTDECNATYGWEEFDRATTLPPAEATRAFASGGSSLLHRRELLGERPARPGHDAGGGDVLHVHVGVDGEPLPGHDRSSRAVGDGKG